MTGWTESPEPSYVAAMRNDRGWRNALAATLLPALALIGGCVASHPTEDAWQRFEFTRPEMGVPFRVVFYAPNQPAAEAAANAVFQRISQLNDILSDYDTDSELSRLSRTAGQGKAVPVSNDLWFVLQVAQNLSARSNGAFDVTIGPVVSLWRKARREKKLPRPDQLAEARGAVGWRKLELDPRHHTAKLLVPNMKLDLGGIAKGYALDEAGKTLRARGLTRVLITGGGDMVAGEAPLRRRGWKIELAPLNATNAPPGGFLRLRHGALATSGDAFQYVEIDGKRYSHIVDPRTGVGLTDHSLVTVTARSGALADALATAVSVLGPEQGLKLVESTPGAAVRIIRQPDNGIEAIQSRRFGRIENSTGRAD